MGKLLPQVLVAFAISIALLIGVSIALLIGFDPFGANKDWKTQKQKREALLSTRATKEEVIQILGPCVDYSRGGTNELTLREILDREPSNWTVVREKTRKHPGVLFTTTINVQTWVFLDASNRVVDVVLQSQ